jgi:hypothetical protein
MSFDDYDSFELAPAEKVSNVGVKISSSAIKAFQARMGFLNLYDKLNRLLLDGPNGMIIAKEYPEFNIREFNQRKEEIEVELDKDIDPLGRYS